ncbi:MAG: TolC family protein [Terriglobales bacterium]
MRSRVFGSLLILSSALFFLAPPGQCQWVRRFHAPTPRIVPIQGLKAYVSGGKLRLRLKAFLRLALLNDTNIHITQLNMYTAQASVLSANSPFDPSFTMGFSGTRTLTPQSSQISGAQTLSDLSQDLNVGYTQDLPTGQDFTVGFSSDRADTNNAFSYLNPSIATGLNFNLTMPLLENRGNIQYTVPLQQAKIAFMVTTDQTDATVANDLVTDANQYWATVEARDAITVQQQALALANKSYQHDALALKLGALAPGSIFQDESQVAADKVSLVQAQSSYQQQLVLLRRIIGANLNPVTRNIPIVLEEDPSTLPVTPPPIPVSQAVALALRRRPELIAAQRQLVSDQMGLRMAHNALLPQLDLTGTYGAAGLGGNQIPVTSSLGTSGQFVPGGLTDSFRQLFGFDYPTYGFSLEFTLPIGNSANEARLANNLVSVAHDRYSERQEQQQIIQDVRLADTQLGMAVKQVNSAKTSLDLSQKNVAAQQQAYLLGTTTIFELLQAQLQMAQAQETLLSSYIGYQEAKIAYQRADWTLLSQLHLVIQH